MINQAQPWNAMGSQFQVFTYCCYLLNGMMRIIFVGYCGIIVLQSSAVIIAVECRNSVAQHSSILHVVWEWLRQNMHQRLYSQNTPHISLGWVGLWGFLWWAPSAKKKDHQVVSSGWSSVWHRPNTGLYSYLVHNMSRSHLYLGFGHFGWLLFFSVNNILAGLWLNCISSVEITLFLLADILLQHRALFQC